jgi:hypothetical protein
MALEAPSPTQHVDDRPAGPPRLDPGLFAGRLALSVIGLGLLVIGFGWYGISGRGAQVDGATDVRAQLPYLVSGGFLGLALVVLGAALLVVHTTRLERARSEALLEARFDALALALGGSRPAPSGLVLAGSAAYHLPDCRLVDGSEAYVTPDAAEDSGLRPCRLCAP